MQLKRKTIAINQIVVYSMFIVALIVCSCVRACVSLSGMCLFVFYVYPSSNRGLVYIMIVTFPDHTHYLLPTQNKRMLEITKRPTLGG